MAITYRADKGSNLTNDEVDANFRDLDSRIAEGGGGSVDTVAGVNPDGNKDIPKALLKAALAYKAIADTGSFNDLIDVPSFLLASQKGQPNGVASLDSTGVIPSTQLPSYVDDILEFANLAAFPAVGETGKIYVAINGGSSPSNPSKLYRWSGSAYVLIPASPGSTDDVTEGATNLYFTMQRVRDTTLTGLNTALTGPIGPTDKLLEALGKIQNQLGSSSGGSLKASKTFTATLAQTIYNIPGGFTPGLSSVTVDGADIYAFQDTNGADIVMIDGYVPKVGQTVRVTYYKGFSVADALPAGGQAVDAARLGGVLPSGYLKATDFQQFMTITTRNPTAAGQTVFAASRPVAGPIIVAINGAVTRDFTTSAGSANITLGTALASTTDEVDIYEFQGFAVANALAANGVAVDSNRLNGQLAAFYAGVSDLNALAATVAGLPFTKYFEVTVGWVAGSTFAITHGLGLVPKAIMFEGVVKTAFGQYIIGDIFQAVLGGYGGSTLYNPMYFRPTTMNVQIVMGNGGMASAVAAGASAAVTAAQADLKIRVFA